jgi:hypothetical protein
MTIGERGRASSPRLRLHNTREPVRSIKRRHIYKPAETSLSAPSLHGTYKFIPKVLTVDLTFFINGCRFWESIMEILFGIYDILAS